MIKIVKKNIIVLKFIIFILIVIVLGKNLIVPKNSTADIDAVWEKMIEKVDLNVVAEKGNRDVKRFLGLDPESYKGIYYCKASDTMKADEIVLVEFSNNEQAKDFVSKIENYRDERIRVFAGYAPDQEDLLKKSIIEVQANYAVFLVNEDASSILMRFRTAIKV